MPNSTRSSRKKKTPSKSESIEQEILDFLDRRVRDLSQEEYRDVLAGLKFSIEVRLEAVEQELENGNG